ncbi:beta-lactamase family protein [Rhodobacteraceae bacterium MCCB 386]|nr:beta-lactamase family protein [Roseitranquillus sediminis]
MNGAASTVFPWWSFTKTVICACVLRLVERGAIDIDQPVAGKPFTARQLMQNRAGVPDYGSLPSYHRAVAGGEPPWTCDRLLREVDVERLDFPPGTGWRYSNTGYLLLRIWIEESTGHGLARLVRMFVTDPLGLASVSLAERPQDFDRVHWSSARSYDLRWVYHGCLIGTASDAALLLHDLFGGRILGGDSLAQMTAAHRLGGRIDGRPWTETGYGLGLMIGRMNHVGRALGHSGGGPFCVNAVYHFPDGNTPATVAAFTDGTDEGVAERAAAELARS